MSDLIKREDALYQIWDWVTKREFEHTNATYWLQKRIEAVPSADRPQGEWIKDNLGTVICSECKRPRRDNRVNHTNFCNSCGARMKGADDEYEGADDE